MVKYNWRLGNVKVKRIKEQTTGGGITVTGATTFSDNVTANSNLTVKGNMSFGDASTDTLTVSGAATFSAGISVNRVSKNANYTATKTDTIIGVDCSGGAKTITLPTAGTINGKVYIIKDESGDASSNNITVATEGSETIDGANTKTINSDYGVLRIYSDGTNYFTF